MKYLIMFFLITIQMFSQSEEECVFDLETQTDEFVKDIPEFSNYVWNNDRKEATIKLKNGNILIAHRGGCVHFGISGELHLKGNEISINDFDYWFEKVKWIGKRLFNDSDYEILVKSLENKTYTDMSDNRGIYIVIPHKTYNEFLISIKTEEKSKVLYVGYYF